MIKRLITVGSVLLALTLTLYFKVAQGLRDPDLTLILEIGRHRPDWVFNARLHVLRFLGADVHRTHAGYGVTPIEMAVLTEDVAALRGLSSYLTTEELDAARQAACSQKKDVAIAWFEAQAGGVVCGDGKLRS
jgi:hypothetical protein